MINLKFILGSITAFFITLAFQANAVNLKLVPYVSGINTPLAMVQPKGDDRKFVIEQFGKIKIIDKGQLVKNYKESDVADYMKNQSIDIIINLNIGLRNFTVYTMDLTKEYIEINTDYRS